MVRKYSEVPLLRLIAHGIMFEDSARIVWRSAFGVECDSQAVMQLQEKFFNRLLNFTKGPNLAQNSKRQHVHPKKSQHSATTAN